MKWFRERDKFPKKTTRAYLPRRIQVNNAKKIWGEIWEMLLTDPEVYETQTKTKRLVME